MCGLRAQLFYSTLDSKSMEDIKKNQKKTNLFKRQQFGAVVAEQRLLCACKKGLQSLLHSGGALITRNVRLYVFSACLNSGKAVLPRKEDGLAEIPSLERKSYLIRYQIYLENLPPASPLDDRNTVRPISVF